MKKALTTGVYQNRRKMISWFIINFFNCIYKVSIKTNEYL